MYLPESKDEMGRSLPQSEVSNSTSSVRPQEKVWAAGEFNIAKATFVKPLLSECTADCELADAIEALSKLLHVPPNRTLFRQGQAPTKLFLLKAGEIVLTSRLVDKSVLGFRALPGSLIGLPAVAGDKPYSMTATVTRASELHAISLATFREIVGANPRLSFKVLKILAAEVRSARLLVSNALSSVPKSSLVKVQKPGSKA